MTTRLCPFCDSKSDMVPVWASAQPAGESANGQRRAIIRVVCTCANCNNVSTARTRPIGAVRDLHDPTTRRSITDRGDVEWSPMSAPAPDYPHVPEHVGRCAIEAHMAHGVGANAASILMARTTIEATAKEQRHFEGQSLREDREDARRRRDPAGDADPRARNPGDRQ